MKKILVTGGAGFIGSWLCERLIKENNQVICVDDLSTGSKRNILPFLNNPHFQFIEGDVCDQDAISKLGTAYSEIYHLASPASVTYIMEHPVKAALANSVGTNNLLKIALENKAKFLFASSSEAYGDSKEHPQKESYWGNVNPVGVRSGYDEGKRFGEALSMAYHRELGTDVRIVRIFNTYGPNSSPNDTRVIPQLVTQAIGGESLTVHGDGQQTRSFCYVTDMVEGLVKMMESREVGPLNLGNSEEFKVLDIARKILEMTNSKSEITFVARPEDDPSQRKPNISQARERLFWEPKVPINEGLKPTIEYFKNLLHG